MISREDIINETILLITKGESTSISELQYVWENFNQPVLDSDVEELKFTFDTIMNTKLSLKTRTIALNTIKQALSDKDKMILNQVALIGDLLKDVKYKESQSKLNAIEAYLMRLREIKNPLTGESIIINEIKQILKGDKNEKDNK